MKAAKMLTLIKDTEMLLRDRDGQIFNVEDTVTAARGKQFTAGLSRTGERKDGSKLVQARQRVVGQDQEHYLL